MALLSTWALAGLVLIAPLALLHLRRRRPPLHDVPSLLIWLELQESNANHQHRPIPRPPFLLALQALALLALLLALARPAGGGADARRDALPAAAPVSVSVPNATGTPSATSVTLVGAPADALPLARALAAVTGVTLRLRTPSDYRTGEARESELVAFDGWMPEGPLPRAPGVLLIDPPRVPDGHVGPAMGVTAVSGTVSSSPLLEGVDLGSLVVSAGGTRTLSLPAGLRWLAWSPDGPLLAFGEDAGRRVAVLSFDPAMSDLPGQAAFPVLVANLVRALASPAPSAAPRADADANARAAPARARANLAPYLLFAALLVILLEAGYGARSRRRTRARTT